MVKPVRSYHESGDLAQDVNQALLEILKGNYRAYYRKYAAIETLLRKGASPNIEIANGLPALIYAIGQEDVHLVRLLLKYGADPNMMWEGLRPLHLAARFQNPFIMKTLLEAGADPYALDNQGRTALHYAALCVNNRAVSQLLKVGFDPMARDRNGQTALEVAIQSGVPKKTIRILEEATPLSKTCKEAHHVEFY